MLSHSEEQPRKGFATADAPIGGSRIVDELLLATEELSAAEEELRAQNDRLQEAHFALLEERERYRELFEQAPVAYVVTDVNGTIRSANRAAARLFLCRSDLLHGKPIVVFAQDASRRRLRRALRALGTTRDSLTMALNVRDRRERVRRVEATVSVMRDIDGEVVGSRWLILDRTRRARRERARRARAEELESLVAERTAQLRHEQEVKDSLVATVSHEFRTGLAAIGGYAELLSLGIRGSMSAEQLADVHRIHEAYDHLTHIVDDLLSYSKLTSGTLTLDISEIAVVDSVRAMTSLIDPQAQAKQVAIEVEPGDATLVVHADGERLRQILLNLLSNAVKFTPSGGRVVIACRSENDEVCIEVRDTGSGIPADKIDAVFQPFVRLRTTSGEPGTGLGLAISRDLARAMGGDLAAKAAPGHGSIFALRLPRSTRFATPSSG
jgi:PAS domain S-box-containing protein